MTHFLSLTCLSYLRSWYLTCDAVLAGAARDGIDYGEEPGQFVEVDRATGTITIHDYAPPPAPPPNQSPDSD